MEDILARTLQIAEDLLAAERTSAPQPRIAPESSPILESLRPGTAGKSDAEVLDLLRQVVACTPRTADPRFFNQLFAGRIPVATAAEMLAAMLNVSMYTYKAAGANVLLEWEILQRMLELAGMPGGDGTFLPGGSLGNLVGMLLGRNQAAPEMREHGAPAERLICYASAEGHYSVIKNAGLLGMGRGNVRGIALDVQGRMRPDALREAIQADQAAGHLPAVVVATSGTTVRGAFDPLDAIAAVCEEFGVWLHVDAAVGGSVLLHPTAREKVHGIERADSITWDAHKMMGVPLTCSALLVRDRDILNRSFSEAADYLFQVDGDHLNPGKRSIQCGRRNDALKLWAAWQQLGDEGWAQRLDRQLELASYAAAAIAARPELMLCEEPPLVMVNFFAPGKSSPQICERLHAEGHALVGYGDCAGLEAIRLVTMNPEVDEAQIDRLLEQIVAVAGELPDNDDAIANQRMAASRAARSA